MVILPNKTGSQMNKDKLEVGDLVTLEQHGMLYRESRAVVRPVGGVGLVVGSSPHAAKVYWFKLKRTVKFFACDLAKLEAK